MHIFPGESGCSRSLGIHTSCGSTQVHPIMMMIDCDYGDVGIRMMMTFGMAMMTMVMNCEYGDVGNDERNG